jgi:hypothetical protein
MRLTLGIIGQSSSKNYVIIRNMTWVIIVIAAIAVLWFLLRATG